MDFKAIFDNAVSKAENLAKSAARKTGEVAEHTKLSLALKAEKGKLEEMYTTLGKLFYEQVKGTEIRAQVAAQIMEIDEQKLVIDNLNSEITVNSGNIVCEGCGKEMSLDDAFCPNCGKKVEPKKLRQDETSDDISADADGNFDSAFKDVTEKYFS